MKLYLASTSPRRRDLLARLNVPFEVIAPPFEESLTALSPPQEALYFAEQKARSVVPHCPPPSLILGADTLIECDGQKIGKPLDDADALRILTSLSGKFHRVHTAVFLLDTEKNECLKEVGTTTVTFRSLLREEIVDYVRSGEPRGKAGAYAVQGKGRAFIQKIVGDEETVIGLPLPIVRKWLSRYMFFPF